MQVRSDCSMTTEDEFALVEEHLRWGTDHSGHVTNSMQYGNMRELPAGSYLLTLADPSMALLFAGDSPPQDSKP